MAINLATKASPKVVERFKIKSVTEGLFTAEYDWTGVRTVQVRSIDTLPLQDYDMSKVDGSRFGKLTEVGDTVQEMTITKDKAFNGAIDRGNNESTLLTKSAGSVMARQTDEVLVPYVDKYNLGVMAKWNGILTKTGTAPTKSNIIETIMTANAAMSNELVPEEGRVLYMGYTLAINLKLSDQFISLQKLGEKSIVNGATGKIDKTQIRIVPDSYLPAGVHFMIAKTGVALAPKKIQTLRILKDHPDVDGAVLQGRLMHDCFVLDTKAKGIYVYKNAG